MHIDTVSQPSVGAGSPQYCSTKENDMLQLSQRIGPWWLGGTRLQRDKLKHLPEGQVLGGLGRRWRVGLFALKLGGAALDHTRGAAQVALRQHHASELRRQPLLDPRPLGWLSALEIRPHQGPLLPR